MLVELKNEIFNRLYSLFRINVSIICNLPRCSHITVDELHRHLAVDNLDNVHRGSSRCSTSHWRHFAPSVLSSRCEWFPMCRRHTRLVKPFVLCSMHVCVPGERNREKRLEKEGNGEKLRERYSDAKTDIRCSATTITLPRESRAN